MNKYKKSLTIFLAVLFIVAGTYAMDYVIFRDHASWALWLCYLGLTIAGFGFLLKSPKIVISQLYILALPTVIWLIDFFYSVFAGRTLWGVTEYFFAKDLLFSARLVSIEHLYFLPLALFGLWLIWDEGKIKGAWLISMIQITLVYLISLYFTDTAQNVNCVFRSCFPFVPSDYYYPLRWFAIMFGGVFTAKWLFDFILFVKSHFDK